MKCFMMYTSMMKVYYVLKGSLFAQLPITSLYNNMHLYRGICMSKLPK